MDYVGYSIQLQSIRKQRINNYRSLLTMIIWFSNYSWLDFVSATCMPTWIAHKTKMSLQRLTPSSALLLAQWFALFCCIFTFSHHVCFWLAIAPCLFPSPQCAAFIFNSSTLILCALFPSCLLMYSDVFSIVALFPCSLLDVFLRYARFYLHNGSFYLSCLPMEMSEQQYIPMIGAWSYPSG